MRSTLRGAGAVGLACVGLACTAAAQEPSPSPSPPPARSVHPIRDSIDRVAEEVVLAHVKPCSRADRLGVPCFPVTVEQEGPRFSVAEALRRYRANGSPSPSRPPTVAETQSFLSGAPASASATLGGFDPVCTAKKLFGKKAGTTFHLYRTWDARGERPLLTDRPLDPKAYASNPDFHYEYLGKFDGECEAVAAWRKALREATEPLPVPPEEWKAPADPEPPP